MLFPRSEPRGKPPRGSGISWTIVASIYDKTWSHVKCETYFVEETALLSNTWETEFYLSFYLLIGSSLNYAQGIASSTVEDFPESRRKMKMVHASIGFRLDGDLFDRYWTGYLLENVPGLYRENRYQYTGEIPLFVKSPGGAMRQRRVLELHFFDRIAKQMVQCTNKILQSIKDELGMQQGALPSSILNSDD